MTEKNTGGPGVRWKGFRTRRCSASTAASTACIARAASHSSCPALALVSIEQHSRLSPRAFGRESAVRGLRVWRSLVRGG
eukprot:3111459-Rhodomonas_salina.1